MLRSHVLALAVIAIVAACGGGATGGPVAVSLSEWKIEPKTLTAKAGTVTFEIKNIGNLEHNFVISGVKESPSIVAKDAKTIEVVLKAGSYSVVCDLPGHKEAGMTGRLEVK